MMRPQFAAVPPDVRKAPGLPLTLKLFPEASPQDPGGAASKTNEGYLRKGIAFPHIKRESRYAAFAIYHLPFTIKVPC